jgi:hypothetical protein
MLVRPPRREATKNPIPSVTAVRPMLAGSASVTPELRNRSATHAPIT